MGFCQGDNIVLTFLYQLQNLFQLLYTFIYSITHLMQLLQRAKRSITTTDKTSSGGSKKVFDPELQSFTKRTIRFDSFTTKQNSKQQKLTFQKLVEKIHVALDHYYANDQSSFYTNCNQFLNKGFQSWKQKVIDRLSTYQYFQMAIGHKPYTEIQSQIIRQWKKNYLLFAIMTYWYSSLYKIKFTSLKQFKQTYDTYRDFVSQVSSLIFRGWLNNWQFRLKKKVSGLDKLYDETSHFVITDSSEFKKVYEKIIVPLMEAQGYGGRICWNMDLKKLKAKTCVFDLKRQDNLVRTIEVLKKFAKQVKLGKKIQLIRQYRHTLQQQLLQNQQRQIRQNKSRKYEALQKDDIINALIYCIVTGHIQQIDHSMTYLTTLLQQNLTLLSKLQLNSFAIDIIAAVDFLKMKQPGEKSMIIQHEIKHHNIATDDIKYKGSSQLIEVKYRDEGEELIVKEQKKKKFATDKIIPEGTKDV